MHYTMAAPGGKNSLGKNCRGEVWAAWCREEGSLSLAGDLMDNESEKRI
jgi:hypothetical protein